MTSWWDKMNASPRKNLESVNRPRSQLDSLRRQSGRNRKAIQDQSAAVQAELAALRQQLGETQDDLERLTRCLYQTNVIAPADLAAVLPEPLAQD